MNTIIVKAGQSMSDVIIMAMGTLQGAADFCNLNSVALSDDPAVGRVFQVPILTKDNSDPKVLAYLASKNINIGTKTPPVPPPPVLVNTEWYATTGMPFNFSLDTIDFVASYTGIFCIWDAAEGGSLLPNLLGFSEEGVITKNLWVSNIVDGIESERIPITMLIASVPILTYTGPGSHVGSLDIASFINYPNTAETGTTTVQLYKFPGTIGGGGGTLMTGTIITTTGWYELVTQNVSGLTIDTNFYITIS